MSDPGRILLEAAQVLIDKKPEGAPVLVDHEAFQMLCDRVEIVKTMPSVTEVQRKCFAGLGEMKGNLDEAENRLRSAQKQYFAVIRRLAQTIG